MDSVYLVPTRGRPQNATRLVTAWRNTQARARLIFCLDDDDPELPAYRAAFDDKNLDDDRFGFVVNPRPASRLAGILNEMAPQYAGHFAAVGFMGDDHHPQTPLWDETLLDQVRERPGTVAYANDWIQGANLPTMVLLDSRIVQALGYMCPSGVTHMYLDNFWKDLGNGLGTLVYVPTVVVEHLHPLAGKAEWDARYDETNGYMNQDAAAYGKFLQDGGLEAAVGRVRQYLREG